MRGVFTRARGSGRSEISWREGDETAWRKASIDFAPHLTERIPFMEPVGADLKSIRENRKISLDQIAEATRINSNYLRKIEQGCYSDLPGGIYNRAFIRAYCEYLGVNPDEYLNRYEGETAQPNEKVLKTRTKLPSQRTIGFPAHPLMAWGLMLLISVVGLYISRHWISAVFSPYFSRAPITRMPPPEPASPSLQTQQPARLNSTVTPAGPDAATRVSSPSAGPASTQSPVPTEAKSNTSVPPPPPAGTMRIEFHVLEKCWVSVNSDGTRALVKLLESGEDQYFDATERFYVILGNAGGVRLKINGKPAKQLGKPGEVVKMLINQQNLSEWLEHSTG